MIAILREMGIAKRNQIIARQFVEHHRRAFGDTYQDNPRAAEYHRKEYLFWTHQLRLADALLDQQHRYLRACS